MQVANREIRPARVARVANSAVRRRTDSAKDQLWSPPIARLPDNDVRNVAG